jgi:hypothetical protein
VKLVPLPFLTFFFHASIVWGGSVGPAEYIQEIESVSRLVDRDHTVQWKPLSGTSTDRGAELFVHLSNGVVRRLVLDIGLSSRDVILEFLLLNNDLVKVTKSERSYYSSPDGDKDFERPIRLTTDLALYFREGTIVAAQTYDNSDAKKWLTREKAEAIKNVQRKLLAAWEGGGRESDVEGVDLSALMKGP